MPGVPSSRGCDACRKQKKKCDQSKPSCSRCTRLRLDCIGSGQQRYKFKEQKIVTRLKKEKSTENSIVLPGTWISISPIPSNDESPVLCGLVSTLEVTDLRFDLTYYGGFLRDIPRRLGDNAALDSSVAALACAFPSVYTRRQSPEMLDKYVHALKTLRVCLNDPIIVYASNTLCAIYLIEICQSWIGRHDDHITCHGEIIAHLLNAAPVEVWRDDFEVELLVTVCAPVIIESFVNPKIRLDRFFSNMTKTYGESHGPYKPPKSNDLDASLESIRLRNLVKIADYFRNPELHRSQIASTYQQLQTDSPRVRQRLSQTAYSISKVQNPAQAYLAHKEHTSWQAAYGLVNTLVLILGSILLIFDPYEIGLLEDMTTFTGEVIQLAKNTSQYRPLGSGYIPLCLVAAWAATCGTAEQAKVEGVLADWQSDFEETRWMNMAVALKSTYEDLRLRSSLSQLEISLDYCEEQNLNRAEQAHGIGTTGACSVM
ncbi:hypothetical protein BJ875DRAFT_450939 [Amylocarpus encephaloides]|uniref:Zn(2)-C6 fungal-type domain-containing protein n=1 Tax=Amylocarpus encephaloides TaxID=45428 RepID=A0A9P7YRK5_9HELO|nr:hypothetical protein BJ875DRAFT_450939 [Amylocarpus encephaloides]